VQLVSSLFAALDVVFEVVLFLDWAPDVVLPALYASFSFVVLVVFFAFLAIVKASCK
jgi:hypothetical protein